LINVNANNPGVEACKKASGDLLTLLRKVLPALYDTDQSLDLEALAATIGEPDYIEQIYKIIRYLLINDRFTIVQGSLAMPNTIKVSYNPKLLLIENINSTFWM
jgi:glucose-6-phosphate isomerase